jgi:hypothetical protein
VEGRLRATWDHTYQLIWLAPESLCHSSQCRSDGVASLYLGMCDGQFLNSA